MRNFEIEPTRFGRRKIVFVRVTCDCGSSYLSEWGGSIAPTHQIDPRKTIDEIYSYNNCGRYYRIQASKGQIKMFREKKKIALEILDAAFNKYKTQY